jgi:PAS domain S-box-containing protein
VLGIARDITDRKQIEESLKESEFFFKESQHAAFIGSYKADFITGFWESSEVLDRIFGIDKNYDRSVNVGWTNIIHPDDREIMDRYLNEEVILKHKPFNAEYRIVRFSDGVTRWVNGLGKVNFDADKNVISLIGTIQDITERKLAEEAIKDSQSKLSLALKIAHLGAWEYDVVNDLFTFNDSFYAIFRTTADDVGGYTMFSADYANRFVHPDDFAVVANETRSAIETDDPNYVRQFEHRIIYTDGEVGYITVRYAIAKDEKGRTIKTYGINQDITERKRAEEKLIEEQLFNKTMIENLPGIFYLFSYPDIKLVKWNKNQEKILGMTAEEFQYSFSSSWQNDETKIQVEELINRVAQNGYDQAEINLRKKDGNEIPFIITGARLDTKNQTFIMGFGIDFSLQRHVLMSLAQNEAKFRTIFNTTSDAIFIHDPFSGEVLDCNQAAFDMYGYTKEEFLKMDINEFSAAEEGYTQEKSLEKVNTAYKQGSITFEWRGKKKNNTFFWNEANLSKAIIDGEERIVAVVRDIDERKRLLETIRKSEEQYRILAENASDVIWILDLKSEKFTYVSPAIKQLTGFTVEEAYEKKVINTITPDSYKIVTAAIQKNLPEFLENPQHPESHIIQVQQYCKDGRVIWVELSTKYRFNSSGDIEIVGVSRNIEVRKNLEAELREINVTKDKFFSIIAHDLRTPFTSLLGLSEIMADENTKLTASQYRQFSQTLYKTADSTYHLLENLLEWSRLQRGTMPFKPVNILLKDFFYDIDESTIEMVRKKSIKLTFDFSQVLNVTADTNMLHSVMRNLVTNAIKFTNQGGTIFIHASRNEDGSVLIAVKDTGIGMTHEMINDLFRIDTNICRPGTDGEHSTGLGLILCKEFVEKHGGKIWVESEVGKGSTFLFSIPVG